MFQSWVCREKPKQCSIVLYSICIIYKKLLYKMDFRIEIGLIFILFCRYTAQGGVFMIILCIDKYLCGDKV